MKRHFQNELEALKVSLVKMGSVVEEALKSSVFAILNRDDAAVQRVLEAEERINLLELEIDHAILDLLALQQPVASDLRFILAVQKINNDLERMGDHAVNIAESAVALKTLPDTGMLEEIPRMAELTLGIVKQGLDSMILKDPSLAAAVLRADDGIDDMNRTVARKVIGLVKNDPTAIALGLELIRISRNLERVADLTTNIAEDVLFYVQARVVKHHAEEKDDTHREVYHGPGTD
ncbi:MAG: phoU 2 [Bacteroidetes bacterium]|nr:phoU 2 [Bacteroidota bacterium]